MKYVMFSNDKFIIIPDYMNHSDVVSIGNPKSAGFCSIQDEDGFKCKVRCWGKSHSLNLKSNTEDEIIMTIALND